MGRCVSVSALVLVLGLAVPVWAGPPTEALDQTIVTVNRLLEDPALRDKPAKLLDAVRKVVIGCFDIRHSASLALGREWHARTPAERDEFVVLFGDLLEQAYVSRIAARASVQGGLSIRYLDESVDGDLATVSATVESREGHAIPLVYRMIRTGQRWAIYDVVIDGVGLVVNFRAQLQRTIRQSSYSVLIATLKTKLSRLAPTATARSGAGIATAGTAASTPQPAPRAEVSTTPIAEPRGEVEQATRMGAVARLAAPEIPASTPPTRPAPVTSYWLQMGAFANREADELLSRLLGQGLPLAIDAVTADRADAPLLRVRVGPFSDRAQAAAKLRDLQTNGYQPLIAHELD